MALVAVNQDPKGQADGLSGNVDLLAAVRALLLPFCSEL